MGLFWDLIQQAQIHEHASKSQTLEERVASLEEELGQTRALLQEALQRLESHLAIDLDGDGDVR